MNRDEEFLELLKKYGTQEKAADESAARKRAFESRLNRIDKLNEDTIRTSQSTILIGCFVIVCAIVAIGLEVLVIVLETLPQL